MARIELRYGANPHQVPSVLTVPDPSPIEILNGRPGYINILDALGAWQLASDLKAATGKPAAASFKHTSPAGAAVAGRLTGTYAASQFIADPGLSPLATAYVRARGGDRMCSFGDAAAVSDRVDVTLARFLAAEVSDLIIAPAFDAEALALLKEKKKGGYLVIRVNPDYRPAGNDVREIFGFRLEQKRDDVPVTAGLFDRRVTKRKEIAPRVLENLIIATLGLRYTQSNSVIAAYDGQLIGVGAGQQSRIHCTRLACDKADKWMLQQHPRVLALRMRDGLTRPEKANIVDRFLLWESLSEKERETLRRDLSEEPVPLTGRERRDFIASFEGLCLSSDGFFPFRDNIDRIAQSNIRVVAQPGGSVRGDEVRAAADEYGMVMAETGLRLFTH
jgi:AICAR transformylase/IMP cyclohydrolase PurH